MTEAIWGRENADQCAALDALRMENVNCRADHLAEIRQRYFSLLFKGLVVEILVCCFFNVFRAVDYSLSKHKPENVLRCLEFCRSDP